MRLKIFFVLCAYSFAISLVNPAATAAEKIPIALQLAEPLTMPKGKADMGPGLDFVEKQDGTGWYAYPALYWRYGITDDLELLPLGVRYRFLDTAKTGHQAAIKVRLAGASDSNADEAFYSWEAAVEGKFPGAPELAVIYGIGNYRTEYTNGTNVNVLDAGAGVRVSMGKMFAADIAYAHLFIAGLPRSNADAVSLTVHWNPDPHAELTLATTTDFLPKNDSFRLYGLAGISQAYTFGVKWAF